MVHHLTPNALMRIKAEKGSESTPNKLGAFAFPRHTCRLADLQRFPQLARGGVWGVALRRALQLLTSHCRPRPPLPPHSSSSSSTAAASASPVAGRGGPAPATATTDAPPFPVLAHYTVLVSLDPPSRPSPLVGRCSRHSLPPTPTDCHRHHLPTCPLDNRHHCR